MDFFKRTFDDKNENFVRVKCRRLGLNLSCFSNVHHRIFLRAHTTFVSNKNYRSNKDFQKYKKNNPVATTATILLFDGHPESLIQKFQNKTELFLHEELTERAEPDPDVHEVVIVACKYQKFKIKKNKTFFIKAKHAIMMDHKKQLLLVDNIKLECRCSFIE